MRAARARFEGPARRRAVSALDDAIESLGQVGYSEIERVSPLQALLRSSTGRRPIRLEMAQAGKIFGGNYALEISTEEPVLPPTRGLSARGKGVVRMRGMRFRARRGDRAGRRLAERLGSDARLAERLGLVHFERIRVEPEGRPVIRHLGGSVVWVLFPPLVRQIPFVPAQVDATLAGGLATAAVCPPCARARWIRWSRCATNRTLPPVAELLGEWLCPQHSRSTHPARCVSVARQAEA